MPIKSIRYRIKFWVACNTWSPSVWGIHIYVRKGDSATGEKALTATTARLKTYLFFGLTKALEPCILPLLHFA